MHARRPALPVPVLTLAVAALASVALAGTKPLDVVVDFTTSKGVATGASVLAGGERIGTVTAVGFGDDRTVEVRLRIDPESRESVRAKSTFVIVAPEGADAFVEHYVLDPASPPAEDGARFEGAFSVAEVWLRRGRISSEELSRALEHGMDEFRDNLEALQSSPEWEKLRDEFVRMAAQMRSAGEELSRLLDEQLPRLQKQLDDLQRRTEEELARRRATPTP